MTRSRLLLVLLVVGGLAGVAVLIRSRRATRGRTDTTDAPVVPEREPVDGGAEGLPIAGTASQDGGLGAAAMSMQS